VNAYVVDGHDVRMIQRAGQARFLLESDEVLGVRRQLGADDLERDVSVQAHIPRPVDLAHASGPDEACDLVNTQLGASREAHVWWRASGEGRGERGLLTRSPCASSFALNRPSRMAL
jgi:hypothetical protein